MIQAAPNAVRHLRCLTAFGRWLESWTRRAPITMTLRDKGLLAELKTPHPLHAIYPATLASVMMPRL